MVWPRYSGTDTSREYESTYAIDTACCAGAGHPHAQAEQALRARTPCTHTPDFEVTRECCCHWRDSVVTVLNGGAGSARG